MIVILHDSTDAAEKTAQECERNIRSAFKDAIEITTMSAASPASWPSAASWDDLLVVMYESVSFPTAGEQFAAEFLSKNKSHPLILPVALDAGRRKPPAAVERFKAFEFSRIHLELKAS